MATLIITHGPASGQQFALGEHRIVLIGRDTDCTFQILDPQMSRQHMQIKRIGDTATHAVVDCGSTNGVVVNGARIEREVSLSDGDEICTGETRILYAVTDRPDAKTIGSLMRKRGEHYKGTIVGR